MCVCIPLDLSRNTNEDLDLISCGQPIGEIKDWFVGFSCPGVPPFHCLPLCWPGFCSTAKEKTIHCYGILITQHCHSTTTTTTQEQCLSWAPGLSSRNHSREFWWRQRRPKKKRQNKIQKKEKERKGNNNNKTTKHSNLTPLFCGVVENTQEEQFGIHWPLL